MLILKELAFCFYNLNIDIFFIFSNILRVACQVTSAVSAVVVAGGVGMLA